MFLNISVFVIVVCRQLIHPVCLLFSAFFYWNKDYNLLDQLTIFFMHTFDSGIWVPAKSDFLAFLLYSAIEMVCLILQWDYWNWSSGVWFWLLYCKRDLILVKCDSFLFWQHRCVEYSWNVMAHIDAWEGKWRGNWCMEWVASTLHTTLEHGVSSITTADAHTSAASSRLNWRPCRFKWTCLFRRKTKSGFCACAITFQTQSTLMWYLKWDFYYWDQADHFVTSVPF